ncbi:MAG: BTAD domain-containing putative transcriptional regulator [Thermoleophilia bacterium]
MPGSPTDPRPPGTLHRTLPWLRRTRLPSGEFGDAVNALLDDGRFAEAGRLLAGHGLDGPDALTQPLSRLCETIAEHLRRSEELEAEARRHRLAGEELREVLDGLLHRLPAEASTGPGRPKGDGPSASAWRRRLSRPPPAPHPETRAEEPAEQLRGPSPVLEVRMLGPLEVSVDGRPVVRWRSSKARAVFGFLAFHGGRPVAREALWDAFWPGFARESARNNLNVAVHNLRRSLAAVSDRPCVVHRDGRYELAPEVSRWIDAEVFAEAVSAAFRHREAGEPRAAIDRLASAVALYRGPLLADDAVSEWHLPEQRRLEDLYLRALDALGELHLEARDAERAADLGREALACDPCRESSHRLLMRCYAVQHQQHLVSRQLDLCVRTLRERLGVPPAAETYRLFERLTTAR